MNKSYADWARELQVLLAELADLDFGYPLDTNEVLAPQLSPPKVPAGLEDLYGVCDGVSMPDVYVGYFLDSAARNLSTRVRHRRFGDLVGGPRRRATSAWVG